jgi:hypothetical protein
MDADPSEPVEPSAVPVSDPILSTGAVIPNEATPDTPIIIDAVSVTPDQKSVVLSDGAAAAPQTSDSSDAPIDAQLGDSIDAQHPVPDIRIDSDVLLPTLDAMLDPLPDSNLPEPVNTSADDAQVLDLPTTRDGDEAEACSTDCGRPTLSKIDKGKGREVLLDPTSSSTEPISTSTPTPIPTSDATEQANETVCTPPTPSSRTRRSRRDRERGHRPKYQPVLTIRSSHGWLWNQVRGPLRLYYPKKLNDFSPF